MASDSPCSPRTLYGPLRAVDNVTFELAAGTVLGFIGPNGAGKSTTMRIIATLEKVAQQRGIEVVVNQAVWVSDAIDLTPEVMRALDAAPAAR